MSGNPVAGQQDRGIARPQAALQALDITVLMGGPSAEREVSLESGAAVAAALNRIGHRVTTSDIAPTNLRALDIPTEVVFIALHGTFGEDGELQSILEARGIPFVGSDARSSRLAMDKVATKECCLAAGLATPDYVVATAEDCDDIARKFPLPAVIKPVDQGSSVDTFVVDDRENFAKHLRAVVANYGRGLVETYVDGPEMTVGIIGDLALPVCEIRTPRQFYDYTAKYLADSTEYCFDLELEASECDRIRELSLAAHRSLGCRDFSRVDWRIDGHTGIPQFLEVNTIPGFTGHSLLPKAAARVGLSFDQLCSRIVELAMAR